MKNKIINLKNGLSVYVADEIIYENRKYIYALQYDKLTENITGKYYILEVTIINDKLNLTNVDNKELNAYLYKLFTANQLKSLFID
ncbi:MAG: hypothetical protein PUD34_02430 [bacterium]|nr:hypothetical protein [bacterium]